MNIQSFSVIAGTAACNAACPFCISKMTGIKELGYTPAPINWQNFKKACRLAQINKIPTVLITGKGEPTLYPDQLTQYLEVLAPYEFPIIELQTNGLNFMDDPLRYDSYLKRWHELGLSLIAISIVSTDAELNRKIYTPGRSEYIQLNKLVSHLHDLGYSVRFSVTLINGFTDTPEKAEMLISEAHRWGVEQISLRPVAMPSESESKIHAENTKNLLLTREKIQALSEYLTSIGHPLVTYGHGSVIYDVHGQNVCLTNALTIKSQTEDIRQMIFFPDGHIRFDWQYKGAVIL